MSENAIDYEALRDEHLDTMIKLAFQYREMCEIENLIAQEDTELSADEEKLAQMAYRHFEQKLAAYEKAEKKKLRRERLKKVAPLALEIAACLVLAAGIAVPVAIANSPEIRVQVMKLLVSFEEGHVDVGMEEDTEASFYVPVEWVGNYYPCYIPENYELIDIHTAMPSLDYEDKNGNYLCFYECNASASFGINSVGAEITYEVINGFDAMVISNDYGTSVNWSDGTSILMVEGTAEKDEIIEIAKNVRRIK